MVVNAHRIPEPPDNDFWVFGYGSLMWNPGFRYTDCREARLFGYRRALCVLSCVDRGTPEQPGLVFGLLAGGSCVGRAFQVPRSHRLEAYDYLMEREMVRGTYRPKWLAVDTTAGRVSALSFVVDRHHQQFAPNLSERQIVRRIRQARGTRGSNLDYIVSTCRHLEELGIAAHELIRIRDALLAGGNKPGD